MKRMVNDLNAKDVESSKTEKRRQENEEEERKWTRDIIFEAEQLVLKSEIDSIKTKKSTLKDRESKDTKQILKEPLCDQPKETKFGRYESSSTPTLMNAVVELNTTCLFNRASTEPAVADGNTSDSDENHGGRNSRTSSVISIARRISRSTSRSWKWINHFGLKTNDKELPILLVEQQKEEGAFALLRAAKNNSIFQIQTLIEHGISTEIVDKRGWTPLAIALENENIECAEMLVQMNANVNFVHTNGMTVLHQITSNGMYKGVKFLLRHGANVNAQDSRGWPPVHHAIKNNHLKCTALLLAAGCDSEVYTWKRVKEYEEAVRLATVGKWKYHWQKKLDIDMGNEIQL